MTGSTQVVVIGGGYAGVMAANRLTQRDDVTVTLINPRPTFVERIRLHQLVGGSDKVKELVCRGTVKQLADEARKPGSHSWTWAQDDKRRQLLGAGRGGTPATAEQTA